MVMKIESLLNPEHINNDYRFETELSFSVVLSPESSRKINELGLDYIPSESVCYPAKISHGHIRHLVDSGVRSIFYPCIMFERKEFKDAVDHYNCPIVTSYPVVLAANMGDIKDKGVEFIKPFLPLDDYGNLAKRIEQGLFIPGALAGEIKSAVKKAAKEYERYRSDIRSEAERILSYLKEKKRKASFYPVISFMR
jgi:predicted nucleotide-binding protein (sugar kinase/HSP70/actin superfamily)